MNSAPLYPLAAEMVAQWKAASWSFAPACRDRGELLRLVVEHRDRLREIAAMHIDPRARRVWRETRGDFAEALRLLRTSPTRRSNAHLHAVCGRIADALSTLTDRTDGHTPHASIH